MTADLRLLYLGAALLVGGACRATPPALAPSSTVMAETARGQVPMLPLGRLQRAGDGFSITSERGNSREVPWVDLLRASRILGVVVNQPDQTVRTMRVWLWRGPTPRASDLVDITGEVTPLGDDSGYRIAFRDLSGEPVLQRWARGEGTGRPAILTVHPHDNGFAIGFGLQRPIGTPFRIGVGAPGSTIYAIRFGT
jgi:hypothetical protein